MYFVFCVSEYLIIHCELAAHQLMHKKSMMIMYYIVGTFLPDAVPQSGNFHVTNKCAVVKNTFSSLSA